MISGELEVHCTGVSVDLFDLGLPLLHLPLLRECNKTYSLNIQLTESTRSIGASFRRFVKKRELFGLMVINQMLN